MPDSAQQTFIQVGPAGEITYDFAGHISADGLDLLASPDTPEPPDQKVRWLRQSDGAVVAEFAANYLRNKTSSWLVQSPDDPAPAIAGRWAKLQLAADDGVFGAPFAQIYAEVCHDGTYKGGRLLDEQGQSDWAFKPYVYGNTAGGADVTFTFTLPRDNMRVLIGTHATAYASAVATSSIRNDLDGVFVGDNVLFINVTNQHLAYSNLFITRTNLAAGNHSMRIRPSVNCLRDGNDYNGIFVVAL